MAADGLIGLDFGSESARGVLIDAGTGRVVAQGAHPYRHGVMTALPNGGPLPPGWALQDAADYEEAAEALLGALGRGQRVRAIGLGFTASSPLPALADGTPLSALHPGAPHAYVKLWKHAAAQPWADRVTARGGAFLLPTGGRLSANSLIAKAAELAERAPHLWAEAGRFIEAGDWLAWRLTGVERRSRAFAAYKALHDPDRGFPAGVVPGLGERLGPVVGVGEPVGALSGAWRDRTGVAGEAVLAAPVIDSHAVLPAVGAVGPGALVGALGTSAVYLLLDGAGRALPPGIEGVATGAALPGLGCFEAGQAGFGDALGWFVRAFPRGAGEAESFAAYEAEAAALAPGASGLVALDWLAGNRVPHGDARLGGLLAGLTLRTTAAEVYRALVEGLCFGARLIVERLEGGGAPVARATMTSGLSLRSPLLVQTMADALGRDVVVPERAELTAVGAAIHGAAAAGVVASYAEGAARFGEVGGRTYRPAPAAAAALDRLYGAYRAFGDAPGNRDALLGLAAARGAAHQTV